MSEVARLYATIGADLSEFNAGMAKAGRDFAALGRRMTAIGQKLTIGVTLPLAAIGAASVKTAADFEALAIGLEAVTGSAAEAGTQMARLREIAKLPAVDLEQAAQASIAFQAIGQEAEFAERMIRGVANAVALSGGSGAEFGGVLRQLRQVASLGRLMGEEMNVILENAPAMAKAIQQAFGTTSTEAIREMNLSTEEFFERLMTGMESLPQVAGGAANSFQNFGQAIREAANAIGQQLLPVVLPAVEAVSRWAESLREMNPETLRWAIAIGAVAAALGPLLIGLGAITTALGLLASALSIGLLPLIAVGGPLILGLGALAALFVKNKLDAAALKAEVVALSDEFTKLTKAQTLAQFLGHQARIDQLELEQALYASLANGRQKIGNGITTEDVRDAPENLRRVTAELEALRAEAALLEKQFLSMASTTSNVTPPKVPFDDKYIATLTEAVRLGLATNEQVLELRRLSFDLARAAEDVNRPLERRIDLINLANDGIEAGIDHQRRLLLMSAEESGRLRLQSPGTVLADNLPTAEEERAALGIRRMSEEMQELQRVAAGIGASFADAFGAIVSGTMTAADAFKNLAQSIIRDLAAMIARMAIFHGLMALFGGPALGRVFGNTLMGFDIGGGVSNVTAGNVVSSGVMSQAVSPVGDRGATALDFSNFPAARNPLEAARDADWQLFFRESGLVATSQGFTFAPAG